MHKKDIFSFLSDHEYHEGITAHRDYHVSLANIRITLGTYRHRVHSEPMGARLVVSGLAWFQA